MMMYTAAVYSLIVRRSSIAAKMLKPILPPLLHRLMLLLPLLHSSQYLYSIIQSCWYFMSPINHSVIFQAAENLRQEQEKKCGMAPHSQGEEITQFCSSYRNAHLGLDHLRPNAIQCIIS